MFQTDNTPTIPQAEAWGTQNRTISDSSLTSSASSEQLALVGFANCLYTETTSSENDVRQDARLLMSLSCLPPGNDAYDSGRSTPPSDASSCYSSSSRSRTSFTFSCPSLSLENHSQDIGAPAASPSIESLQTSTAGEEITPAQLLGRVLKVDDRDALRLSSEAMALNIMQSYDKAIQWRVQSWIASLSRVLVDKEKELKSQGLANDENLKILCESSEALLIIQLREICDKIRAVHGRTKFRVLPQRLLQDGADGSEKPTKRQRTGDDSCWEDGGLEESEYEYTVTHLLSLECDLSIQAPGTGNIVIDLQVPGTMKGTFRTVEDGCEQLTDVMINIDTDMLASMIEKSSRTVVRATVEALLKNSEEESSQEQPIYSEVTNPQETIITEESRTPCHFQGDLPSFTPKRKYSEDSMPGAAVITPRDSSSPSSFEDGDNEDKPIIPTIPDNFNHVYPTRTLTPQSNSGQDTFSSIATRLLPMKRKDKAFATVVTPSKTVRRFVEGKGPGPNLPTLVEAALQLHSK